MPPIHGLIAATFTPMHDDGRLRLDRVPEMVDRLVARGVEGLYVCGSTGEGPLLSGAERRAVAEAFVRASAGRVPVVVQVGHNSLVEARDLAEHAHAIGADAISATPATYFKPKTLADVVDGIEAVAGGAPGLPFFYYHIPPITGVEVDVAELMIVAAARVPTLPERTGSEALPGEEGRRRYRKVPPPISFQASAASTRAFTSARNRSLRTLPEAVRGKSSRNSKRSGIFCLARPLAATCAARSCADGDAPSVRI